MMLFQNPGLIDLAAVRTMGVSVKRPGSFGYFGTGLKFAIATILRGGGSIAIYRGAERHEISTTRIEIRGEEFEIICLDGEPMGITTQLGRNWQPWMVLRELGCNAIDEGGSFEIFEGLFSAPADDLTSIVVEWDALDEAFEDRGNLFLDRLSSEPIIRDVAFEAFDRPSQFIYYRGIRAYKLEKGTALTYNLISDQTLTEDRNLYGSYSLDEAIKAFLLKRADQNIIERMITIKDSRHEAGLSFVEYETASRAFLDSCIATRERGEQMNASARKIMLKAMRRVEEVVSGGTIGYRRITSDALSQSLAALKQCGISVDPEKTQIVVIDEMPGEDQMSMAENGRIYIAPALLQLPIETISYEILRRWVDINCPLGSADEVLQIIAKPLLGHSLIIQSDRRYWQDQAEADGGLPKATIDDEAANAEPDTAPEAADEANRALEADQALY